MPAMKSLKLSYIHGIRRCLIGVGSITEVKQRDKTNCINFWEFNFLTGLP